jgi:superfamily II DNA or RNA helicase
VALINSKPPILEPFMQDNNITDIHTYLRAHAAELGARILETYPPLQSTKDPIAPAVATLLRKALPAQGLAITGTAKYLRQAKAARIVADCGAGKTFIALGTIHALTAGRPSTTLVMCPSHITHKWAREVLLTIPRARAFLIKMSPRKQLLHSLQLAHLPVLIASIHYSNRFQNAVCTRAWRRTVEVESEWTALRRDRAECGRTRASIAGHGTTRSISSRNSSRRLFRPYFSNAA